MSSTAPASQRQSPDCHQAMSGHWSLHGEAALVSGLPFGKRRAIIEREARRLLGDIDVECRAKEGGGDDQGKLSGEHDQSTNHRR